MLEKDFLLQQFDEIEKKISRLVENSNNLEAANQQLREKNHELEIQLQDLKRTEEKHNEVKVLIRSKIDSLMERLDGHSESPAKAID